MRFKNEENVSSVYHTMDKESRRKVNLTDKSRQNTITKAKESKIQIPKLCLRCDKIHQI